MANEVDRCERCNGTGTLRSHRHATPATAIDTVEQRSEHDPLACEVCRARGALDPLASLVRAIALGQTLAWCTVHAPDGTAPMKAFWAAASAQTRFELLARVHGAGMYALVGDPHELDADAFARNLREIEPPTLAAVLDAARPPRRA